MGGSRYLGEKQWQGAGGGGGSEKRQLHLARGKEPLGREEIPFEGACTGAKNILFSALEAGGKRNLDLSH